MDDVGWISVEDGNKLIAEFMGFTSVKTEHDEFFNSPIEPPATLVKWHYHLNNLIFHSSWDWLMGVIEKIESTKNYGVRVQIHTDGTSIICYLREGTKSFDYSAKNSKIESAWLAVIAFIKHHNASNKPKSEIKNDSTNS